MSVTEFGVSIGVGEVGVGDVWENLAKAAGSVLIDVRTQAEWAFVGVADLGPIGKSPILLEWLTFPDQQMDPNFVARLKSELDQHGATGDTELYFLCRSGVRSLAAARAMAAAGYKACHNVIDGFEGPRDDAGHRGSVGGWKAAGLPWLQG